LLEASTLGNSNKDKTFYSSDNRHKIKLSSWKVTESKLECLSLESFIVLVCLTNWNTLWCPIQRVKAAKSLLTSNILAYFSTASVAKKYCQNQGSNTLAYHRRRIDEEQKSLYDSSLEEAVFPPLGGVGAELEVDEARGEEGHA